jgi:hypothetical protein
MALLTNTLEGGTEGTNVTVANSGGASGTAFTTVTTPASQSQYRASAAFHGSFGMLVNSLSTAAPIVDLDDATAASSVAIRFYIRMDSYPSVTNVQFPVNFRSLSGSINRTDFDNTGGIRIGGLAYSSDKLALSTWYRIECQGTGFGAGAGAGTLSMQVYVGDNTGTPYINQTASGLTLASQVQRVRYGKNSSSPTTADFTYALDDFAQNVGSSTPLGPASPPPPSAGSDQSVSPGTTVTLSGTGTGTWSQVGGSPTVTLNGSGATVTFTAPYTVSGTVLTFDYGGDTMDVAVAPASAGAAVTNTAEGGTDGVTITTGNTGGLSGTPFTLVSQGAAGTITFATAAAYRGNLGYSFNQPSDSLASLVDMNENPSDSWTARFYIYLNTLPTSNDIQFPVMVRSSSGPVGRTEMNTSGQIRIVNGTTGSYSSTGLSTGTWYRVEYYGSGAGTSNTDAFVDVYVGDSGTPLFSLSRTGQTTTEQVILVRYGKASSTPTSTMSFYIDDIGQTIGSAVPLGPSPTGFAGADQTVEPWSTVTLTGTDTGTWSQVSGAAVTLSGSGASRTFEAPGVINDTTLIFDYGGDQVSITVLAATERAVISGVEVPLRIEDV